MLRKSTKMEDDIADTWKIRRKMDSADFSTKTEDTTKACGETTPWTVKAYFTMTKDVSHMTANGIKASFMEREKSTTIVLSKWMIILIIEISTKTLKTTGNIMKVLILIFKG